MGIKLKPAGLAIVAGGGMGFLIYNLKSAKAPACVLNNGVTIPDSTQTLWEAVKGAESHFGEDAALATGGLFDLFVHYNSLGLIEPNTAAAIYGWWEGLDPQQQDAVNYAESNGGLDCVAAETANQVATAGTSIFAAIAAGLLVYAASSTFGIE